ncbi:MAG: hypothetical protein APR53_09155 [Methanoculleus sp. SDB]|nr:MAG: hypothetical protein APR53_09155 [Methanoculleus sp. SDB]
MIVPLPPVERWGKFGTEFEQGIPAVIGSAVGPGNLWRFPCMDCENGGGASLIPYRIALLSAASPSRLSKRVWGYRARAGAPLAFRRRSGRGDEVKFSLRNNS